MIVAVPGPEVIKLFSCSTRLSTKFQLTIKTKTLTNKQWEHSTMLSTSIKLTYVIKDHKDLCFVYF